MFGTQTRGELVSEQCAIDWASFVFLRFYLSFFLSSAFSLQQQQQQKKIIIFTIIIIIIIIIFIDCYYCYCYNLLSLLFYSIPVMKQFLSYRLYFFLFSSSSYQREGNEQMLVWYVVAS